MPTTKQSHKAVKSLTFANLVRALMALVPWLLTELNKEHSPNSGEISVFFDFDAVNGRLRTVAHSEGARPFVRSVSQTRDGSI